MRLDEIRASACRVRLLVFTAVFSASLAEANQRCNQSWCQVESYLLNAAPSGVALGDFDRDRRNDLAVASMTAETVSILFNLGDGSFGSPTVIQLEAGSTPHSVVAADVDNDLDLDLVVSRSGMDDIQIMQNEDGVIVPGAVFPVSGTTPQFLEAADLNNDGFVDIVTSNRDSDSVSVLLNSADGLTAPVTYGVDAGPRGLALATLGSTSALDIVVAAHDAGAISHLVNQGDGTFAATASFIVDPDLSPEDVSAADLDADGDWDVAAATYGNGGNFATVWSNLGGGNFGVAQNLPLGNVIQGGRHPVSIVAVDFRLDRLVDLAVANIESSDVYVLHNQEEMDDEEVEAILGSQRLQVGDAPVALVSADLDGNGSMDLVTANRDSEDLSVLINSSILFAGGFEAGDSLDWTSTEPQP